MTQLLLLHVHRSL